MKLAFLFCCSLLAVPGCARGETGYAGWLRYEPITGASVRVSYSNLPATVVALDSAIVEETAQHELIRGIRSMLGRTLRSEAKLPDEDCILLGSLASVHRAAPDIALPELPTEDTYLLLSTAAHAHRILLITAPNERGVLYGAFALLRKIALHDDLQYINEQSVPYARIRWTNEWDNLDGSIERGYAGRSIFFENGHVPQDLTRAGDYARLLSSIGVDGCTVNNVNANPLVLSSDFLSELARIAEAFRPWGVRLSISVDFSSPKTIGHLDTFDPLNPKVTQWWKDKADEVYKLIPDLGGIVLKADSEGRVGPSTYGRTHADAANVIARALKPHGGVLVYRGFVYNHHMDWRDLKNDRARAAYDNFAGLDGKFDDNVLVQIKYGPIDFQVREPVSPLFGALQHTNETIEFQVTQEYTGQQRHLCFLLPMWEEVLNFDMRVNGKKTFVKDIVSGKSFSRPQGGFVAVTNVGQDQNWLGFDLAMANLYAFGRIAWNPDLPAEDVVDEWTRLTFGSNSQVVQAINDLQLESWRTYEDYTGPLGAGGLTDIAGDAQHIYIGSHYGPGIESSERNGWGQWHRADKEGIGMDRTVATGTGYTAQYPPEVAAEYESLDRCPDNLLLFFHHVPYSYKLHSGKTVIQHIYDSHYDGAAHAQTFAERWKLLDGLIDEGRYQAVLKRLEYQGGHAIVWRDTVCNWFLHESGIADAQGRVGHHADRIEAEAMSLDGYIAVDVAPWEDASGWKAVSCPNPQCSATQVFRGERGWYKLAIQYFDQNDGASHFELLANQQQIAHWTADMWLPTRKPDSNSSTRFTTDLVALRPGDQIKIVGTPDGGERAALDYMEIKAASAEAASPAPGNWVASWAASQQVPEPNNALPPDSLRDTTLRQIVHLSVGGKTIRVHISNAFGIAPLHLTGVHVARPMSTSSSAIDAATDRALTFNGRKDVSIPAGAEFVSDPLIFDCAPLSSLAISIHYDVPPSQQTGHPGSRATSYLSHGDLLSARELTNGTKIDHWYQLSGVDVEATSGAASIVALGDSITDGHGATTNGNDRWTDVLTQRLQGDRQPRSIGVLNEGIGGNHLLTDGLGPNALARFDRDVLAQPGVRYLLVLEGVNDLGALSRKGEAAPAEHSALVEQIIAAYEQIIVRAHAHGVRVVGCTILPYVGSDYYHPGPVNEADRKAVNNWIRALGHFDAVVDFDAVTRDPAHPDRLKPAFDCGDHLHPSPAGYAAMANSIPLSLFQAQ